MTDIQKLRQLGLTEMLALASSVVFLPVVAMLLKRRGFRKTEKMLSSLSRAEKTPPAPIDRVRRIARMTSVASVRGPYKARCLEQAITLWWILGLIGIASTIRLGIYKKGDAVEAHAWVLYQDEVVIGETADLGEFTPLLDVNVDRASAE